MKVRATGGDTTNTGMIVIVVEAQPRQIMYQMSIYMAGHTDSELWTQMQPRRLWHAVIWSIVQVCISECEGEIPCVSHLDREA